MDMIKLGLGGVTLFTIINEPMENIFYNLIAESKRTVKLCAPYIKENVMKNIYKYIKSRVRIDILTNFSLPNFYYGSSDIEAFKYPISYNDNIYNYQLLHAKLYIFDDKYSIITSANLTNSGFQRNLEYGILINDKALVGQTIKDYNRYTTHNNTGIIDLNIINEANKILKSIPEYEGINYRKQEFKTEIDNILDVDIDLIKQSLSNWKMITIDVINLINKDEFSLSDLYAKEKVFKHEYPDNNTVRDSIRRNLQELRDIGLVKFLGNGKYKRLWK